MVSKDVNNALVSRIGLIDGIVGVLQYCVPFSPAQIGSQYPPAILETHTLEQAIQPKPCYTTTYVICQYEATRQLARSWINLTSTRKVAAPSSR